MIWRLIAALVGGFAAHQLDRPISAMFNGSRWGLLMRYAVGYLALIPFRIVLIGKIRERGERRLEDDLLANDLLVGGAFGTGVMLGYLFDDAGGEL